MIPTDESNEAPPAEHSPAPDSGAAPMAVPVAPTGGVARILAPFRYLFRPSVCGRVVAASPWCAYAAFPIGLLLICGSVHAGAIIDQMYEYGWNYATTQPSYNATIVHRSFPDAYQALGNDYFTPVEATAMIFGITTLWTLVATLVYAWLALPAIHRFGSAWRSFASAIGVAMAAVVGPGSLLVIIASLSITLAINADELKRFGGTGRIYPSLIDYWFGANIVGVPIAIAMLGAWVRRAAVGARSSAPLPDTPPTCEGCGYDLTHLSEAGRCTECGMATEISLDPVIRRIGIAWEREPLPANWVETNAALVVNPRQFYERLRMRENEAHGFSFAFLNYLGVGAASMISIFAILMVTESNLDPEEILGTFAFGFVFPAVFAWLLHAAFGALAATGHLFRGGSRPFAHVSKVWQYESAYLWVIFIVGHGLAWSFALFDDWMSDLMRAFTGISWFFVEPLVVLIVLGVVLIGWSLRYRRAIQVVRWANL